MPKAKTPRLRIYCICGQKMKVSSSMYGRPGKCVACRQKIRIPKADEIPLDAREIHLKDHPEFLRKPAAPPDGAAGEAPEELEVVRLGEEDQPKEAVRALDVLAPLQQLCSLETKVDRHLKALEGFDRPASKKSDKQQAELLGQRARIRRARADLDESLRQRLMDTAVDLTTVQERLADLSLAVRVGEVDFRVFRDQADKLRRRRDRLEQRQQNLRGWLSVRDVQAAGGFVDLPLTDVPAHPEVRFPRESDPSISLVSQHLASLREALERREASQRKLRTAELMRPREGEPAERVEGIRAECKAAERRARAGVAFFMGRLRQLRDDYAADLQAIESQLDLARGRLQVGEITRSQYDDLEDTLVRAKSDLTKASDVIGRALSAPSSADVPQGRGTFLGRLTPYKSFFLVSRDSYLAWGAAALLVISLFLPVADGVSPTGMAGRVGSGVVLSLMALVPFLAALALIPASLVPSRPLRGTAYTAIWFVGTVFFLVLLQRSIYGQGALNRLYDQGVHIFAQPSVVFWSLAAVTLLAAAFLTLAPVRAWRHVPLAAALVLLLAGGSVFVASNEMVTPVTPVVTTAPVVTARPAPPVAPVVAPGPAATTPQEPAAEAGNVEGEPETQTTETPEEGQATDQNFLGVQTVDVEWRGRVGAPGRAPVLSISIYWPGQPPDNRMLEIGDTVYGDWKLSAYNPVTQTVTLQSEKDLIVLRSGRRETLETLR